MATSSGRTTPLIFVAGVCTVLLLSTLTAHAVPVVTPRARLLTSADTRATPTVFLTPSTSSSSSTPFSREMSIVTGAPFTIEVVVRASSQVPVAMPGSATNAAGHTVMAPESSPYVEPDMKPVEDVTVVVAVPSGIMAIGDVVLQQVSAGTGAVVDMTAAQATVAVQYSQPRTRPGLYLDDQLFPDIANVSSTVDVVSFSLLSLPPAAAVKLSLRSSIATGSVQVGALPPYAVGSSFAVTNTSSPEQQRTYVQADVRRLEVTCDAVASCNSAGSCLSTGACSCVATWGDTGCSTGVFLCGVGVGVMHMRLVVGCCARGVSRIACVWTVVLLGSTFPRCLFVQHLWHAMVRQMTGLWCRKTSRGGPAHSSGLPTSSSPPWCLWSWCASCCFVPHSGEHERWLRRQYHSFNATGETVLWWLVSLVTPSSAQLQCSRRTHAGRFWCQ